MECRDFVAKDHELLCPEGARCLPVAPPHVNLNHCLDPVPILEVRRLRPLRAIASTTRVSRPAPSILISAIAYSGRTDQMCDSRRPP